MQIDSLFYNLIHNARTTIELIRFHFSHIFLILLVLTSASTHYFFSFGLVFVLQLRITLFYLFFSHTLFVFCFTFVAHRFRPLIQIAASMQWSTTHSAMATRKLPILKSSRAAVIFVSAAIWISSEETRTSSRSSQPTEVSGRGDCVHLRMCVCERAVNCASCGRRARTNENCTDE